MPLYLILTHKVCCELSCVVMRLVTCLTPYRDDYTVVSGEEKVERGGERPDSAWLAAPFRAMAYSSYDRQDPPFPYVAVGLG